MIHTTVATKSVRPERSLFDRSIERIWKATPRYLFARGLGQTLRTRRG